MRKLFISLFILMTISLKALCAPPVVTDSIAYACKLTNIVQTDTSTITFDIYVTNLGVDTLKFAALEANISFNYTGIANGGTITGTFEPGSASSSLATIQKSPRWKVENSTKRIIFKLYPPPVVGSCYKIPYTDSVKLGTFILVDTKPFTWNSQASFAWAFTPGASLAYTTSFQCYILHDCCGRDVTAADLTVPVDMIVYGNPVLNPH
jgi:hypothetical protein